jgi:hypothetical protein
MKIAGSGSICQRHGSADPDPYQNVMDPQHWLNHPSYLFSSVRRNPVIQTTGPVFELKLNITDSELVVVADTAAWDTSAVILRSTTVLAFR